MQESINAQTGRTDAMRNTFPREMDEKSDHALDTLADAGVRAAGEHGLDERCRRSSTRPPK